jgi:hypothetical protein
MELALLAVIGAAAAVAADYELDECTIVGIDDNVLVRFCGSLFPHI